ncbi:TfoX/Sxy family protein [Mesorhizobium sp. M0045]|uniref:TfoX/Sxy family protein n=1 Tax=unclassified Mesorhizobium TaxID=325217 RepID=UPI003339AAB2
MAKSVTSIAPDPMVDRLRAALGPRQVTEQKMFGGTCFMLNGNMLIGTSKRGLLVRVGKEGHAAAAARPYARPMEMGGRSMEGYVHVAPEGTATEADLRGWLDLALAFVETLPPKIKSAGIATKRA